MPPLAPRPPPLERRQTDALRYMNNTDNFDERKAYRAGRRDAELDLFSETASSSPWDELDDPIRNRRPIPLRRTNDLNDREWGGYPTDRRGSRII